MTALILTTMILLPLGFPQPEAGTTTWLVTRPFWFAALFAVLFVFVLAYRRFERIAVSRLASGSTPLGAAGALLVALGILALSVTGLVQAARSHSNLMGVPVNPTLAMVFIESGVAVLRISERHLRAQHKLSAAEAESA